MIRRPPRSTLSSSSAASDVYKRQVVCLLNAETLKNPYTNTRKDLVDKLERYNAEIKYIQDSFIDAENKTNVEIALIKVTIPITEHPSVILEDLKKEERHREEATYINNTKVVHADFLKGIVQQYNFEVKAVLKLIAEWNNLNEFMFKGISLGLVCDEKDDKDFGIHNAYIK